MYTDALNFPEILGNQKLLVIFLYNHDIIMYTYCYIFNTFSDQKMEVFNKYLFSCALQRVGTSDVNLKKSTGSFQLAWGCVFMQLLPAEVCVIYTSPNQPKPYHHCIANVLWNHDLALILEPKRYRQFTRH